MTGATSTPYVGDLVDKTSMDWNASPVLLFVEKERSADVSRLYFCDMEAL